MRILSEAPKLQPNEQYFLHIRIALSKFQNKFSTDLENQKVDAVYAADIYCLVYDNIAGLS